MRVDLGTTDDTDTLDALQAALAAIGAQPDDYEESGLGVGFQRFHAEGQMLTVYVDAWGVDLEGPDELVNRVLSILAGAE